MLCEHEPDMWSSEFPDPAEEKRKKKGKKEKAEPEDEEMENGDKAEPEEDGVGEVKVSVSSRSGRCGGRVDTRQRMRGHCRSRR